MCTHLVPTTFFTEASPRTTTARKTTVYCTFFGTWNLKDQSSLNLSLFTSHPNACLSVTAAADAAPLTCDKVRLKKGQWNCIERR